MSDHDANHDAGEQIGPPIWPAELDGVFEVRRLLGTGASGSAWSVRVPWSRAICAVKVFHDPDVVWPPPAWRGIQRIHHPALLPVRTLGRLADGRPWVSRPLADGVPLSSTERPLRDDELLHITGQLLDLLGHIHGAGYVHGDIKPDNIIVRLHDAFLPDVFLIDFGLAEHLDQLADQGPRGTIPYMAPELFTERRITPAADLYALATSVYEAAAGRPPYTWDDGDDVVPRIVQREILDRVAAHVPACLVAFVDGVIRESGNHRLTVERAREHLATQTTHTALAQTRVGRDAFARGLRDQVRRRLTDPSSAAITLLDGVAGIGKRTIAHLLGDELRFLPDAPRLLEVDVDAVDGDWLGALGLAAQGAAVSDEGADDDRLYRAACALVDDSTPTVVIVTARAWRDIDDRALSILAERIDVAGSPLAFVVASSSGYSPWTRRPMPGVDVVEVDPLQDDDLVDIVEQQLGRHTAHVARRLAALADGNPALVCELVSQYQRGLSVDEAVDTATLRSLIWERRLTALDDAEHHALVALVLCDEPLSDEDLAALSVQSEAIRTLVARGVVAISRASGRASLVDRDALSSLDLTPSPELVRAAADVCLSKLDGEPTLARNLQALRLLGADARPSDAIWQAAFDARHSSIDADALASALLHLILNAPAHALADAGIRRAMWTDVVDIAPSVLASATLDRCTEALEALDPVADPTTMRSAALCRMAVDASIGRGAFDPAALETIASFDELEGEDLAIALFVASRGAKDTDALHQVESVLVHIERLRRMPNSAFGRRILARAVDTISVLLAMLHDNARDLKLVLDALDDLPAYPPTIERVGLMRRVASAQLLSGDQTRAMENLDRAERTAREFGWFRLAISVKVIRVAALVTHERMGEAKRLAEEVCETFLRTQEWSRLSVNLVALSNIYLGLGAYQEGITAVSRMIAEIPADVAARFGTRFEFALVRLRRFVLTPSQTRVALRDYSDSVASSPMWPQLAPFMLGYAADTWGIEGDWQKAADAAAQALEAAVASGNEFFICHAHTLRAEAALHGAQYAVARDELDAAMATDPANRAQRWRIDYLRARLAKVEGREDDVMRYVRQAAEPIHEVINTLQGRYRDTFCARRDVAAVLDLEQRTLASTETERTLDRAREIIEIAKDLLTSASRAYGDTLHEALKRMTAFAGAERGALLTVADVEGERVYRQVAFVGQSRNEPLKTSRTVLEQVFTSRKHVMSADALIDRRFSTAGSVLDLGVRSILAFPLIAADELLAIVYLDHRAKKEQFGSVQVKLLGLLAEQLASIVQHARDLEASRQVATSFPGIIGQSEPLRAVLRKAQRVAASDVPILVLGETGVGKDLLARSIHELSDRSAGPYQELNCAAIPRDLLEAELFGAARGAYTGATSDRIGHFGVADTGTLFLDEIGLLTLDAQGKLLTILQKGTYTRVGETRSRHADVRIIAATNSDLPAMCRDGTFRADLYYRLNVVTLDLPPLRDRSDDIPTLYHHFVSRYAEKYGVQLSPPSRDLLNYISHLPWPGNIRQLENVLHAAVLFADDGRVTQQAVDSALENPVAALPDEVTNYHANLGDGSTLSDLVEGFSAWVRREMLARCDGDESEMRRRLRINSGDGSRFESSVSGGSLEDMVNDFKRTVVLRAVERCQGNRTAAAERLGIHRRTIYKILDEA